MRRALLALLAAAAGCDVVLPPTGVDLEPSVQLNALLRAGVDTVAVLIEQTGTEDGSLRTSPVSGARVRLSGPGGEVVLREAPAGFAACVREFDHTGQVAVPRPIGPGCYAGLAPGGVRAGGTYSLAADLPGRGPVAARTTVPHPPEPVTPTEGARIATRTLSPGPGNPPATSDALTLRWRTRRAGEQVIPSAAQGAVFRDGRAVAGAQCGVNLMGVGEVVVDERSGNAFADSLVVRAQVGACGEWTGSGPVPQFRPFRADSVEVYLHLTALDSVYTQARERGGSAVREGSASVGVTGAYGVFAGLASSRRRIVFVLPPA
jgi:hypothetical protein